MNDSRFFYVDDPTVAVTKGEETAVAWVDNQRQQILFQRFRGSGAAIHDKPTLVSQSPETFSWLPRLATSEDGGIFVLWQEIVFSGGSHGGEAYFARSTDGGKSFSQPLNLSQSQAGDGKGRLTEDRWHNGSLDIARSANGDLFVSWTEYQGALWLSRSTDNGESFTEPLRVAGTSSRPARGPSLAATPTHVYLAWTLGQDPEADIHIASSGDGGKSFGPARVVHNSEGYSDAPKLEVDKAGTIHLVYAETPSGIWGPSQVRYTRTKTPGGSFEAPRRISAKEGAGFPSFAADEQGRLHVVWEHYPEPGERPQGLAYASSVDGGHSFQRTGLVPATKNPELGFNGSLQGLLMSKLAVGASGLLAVVNSRFDPGERSRIRLIRGRFDAR